MEFRDALKSLRGELGITQTELANALRVNVTTVSRWEQGQTLPNRSIASVLMDFAAARAASKDCSDKLRHAIANAAKEKLVLSGGSLYAIEHASLSQIVDDASFPIYVCDMETDELLYVNRKAAALLGGSLDRLANRKCYVCLMGRDSPCPFCHKEQLVSDKFADFDTFYPADVSNTERSPGTSDNSICRVYGKLIQWNGRKAHVRYIINAAEPIKGPVQTERGIAYYERLRVMRELAGDAVAAANLNLTHNTILDAECKREELTKLFSSSSLDDVLNAFGKNAFAEVAPPAADDDSARCALIRQFHAGMTHISVRHCIEGAAGYYESQLELMQNPVTSDIEAFVALRDITDTALAEDIVDTLFKTDYETVATIDADTGEVKPFINGYLDEIIAEQQRAGDNGLGVEAYLRKYCVDDDAARVIKETSLQYVKEQLKSKPTFTVAYSLRRDEQIVRKRVMYAYIGGKRTRILCAIQNLTETYRQGVMQRERLAAAAQTLQEVGNLNTACYDLDTRTLYSNCKLTSDLGYGEIIENVPEEFINSGHVASRSVEDFRTFWVGLREGHVGSIEVSLEVADKSFHWVRVSAKLIYGEDKRPYQAIIVFQDVEELREQVVVYKKWRQSLEDRKPEDYTLFRCNLSKGASFDKVEGALLKCDFDPGLTTFNERTQEYASRFVHLDDFKTYSALLNSENLLAAFYRGTRMATLDYRERVAEDEYRWLHLTVEAAQYPDSTDVEVFLMYEPSSEAQTEDPAVKARVDSDPLTGVLNQRAFSERLTGLLAEKQPGAKHALILVDIDGFKRINENFGHAVGDQTLVDVAKSLQAVVRDDGMVSRLGGDEFLICLKDVSSQADVERRATQILATLRKAFSVDIYVTASLGIAFYPVDGTDFNALYHAVDLALYTAKANGKDSFAFYGGDLTRSLYAPVVSAVPGARVKPLKRRMLVVSDDPDTIDLICDTFAGQYSVESCSDEREALLCLRRSGLSLSVVLLSLDIPGMDAFALLGRIRMITNANAVPVIVLSRIDGREMCLRALRHGASDFILEPIDTELMQIRVGSAVSKLENERLRAQNTYLQTQSSDVSQFRAVYENTGTVVVEYDWVSHDFVYDASISEHIYGRYDERSLWQIFMSDMVADVKDVKAMQELMMTLANSRTRNSGSIDIMLKTPSKDRHWFTMNAFKRINEMNLPSKIILTFLDVNEDILASKKLRFLAEHDSLTGLYNRNSFLKLVEDTVRLRPGDSYILLCCDVNDFRFINERYGREEGDRLLQYSAEMLRLYADAMDGFTGRLSNDVFAMLLPNNPGTLKRVAVLVESFFDGYPLNAKITGRAGAYIISDPHMTADAMLDLASTASSSIKGKFASWLAVYDDSMNEKRLREKSITDRMESALAGGQFDVYMQPQFHHATGRIVGAEALVRWIDPEQGVISPSEFIPLFEKNGFITKLDEYVWDKAARYAGEWMRRGNEPVPISVNVSREDTKDPALCVKLLAIVKKYGIPVDMFRLEITESLFANDTERLISVVEQLHAAGFLIEMDDFGSGYSSLNILKDVPVDILKLDMRFFSGKDNLGRGGMIVNAVLRMARWLDIPVIAEGVEHKDHADFLLSVGCPTIQGYLYEKPLPVHEFERLLLANSDRRTTPSNLVDTRLDAHSFWDPLSADSQIFNNYIGPAVVFEYHDGGFEIIRMNRRFIDAMGINESVMLPARGLVHMCEEDKLRLMQAVLDVISSGKEKKVDIQCVLDDGRKARYNVALRVIAKSADRTLIFGAMDA